jgi:Protein kinase domain
MGCSQSSFACWNGIAKAVKNFEGSGDTLTTSQDMSIDMSHFTFPKKVLGLGGYGCVRATKKLSGRDKGAVYALKSLSKFAVLQRSSGVVSVLSELRALTLLADGPFICNIHYAFQDDIFLYMVLDLALGGDMRYNLKNSSNCRFTEARAQFYIAQIIIAVSCCHNAGILHRGKWRRKTTIFMKPSMLTSVSHGYFVLFLLESNHLYE